MDPTRAEVLDWLEAELATRLSPAAQSDILRAASCAGDDAAELMEAFGKRFSVDMAGYRWDWHHHSEGSLLHIGWPIAVSPPYCVHLPLSLHALHLAAKTGRWPLVYPPATPAADFSWANLPLLALGLPALTLLLLWVMPRLF